MTTDTSGAIIAPIAGQDTLQKFIFDNAAVRGQFIDVSHTWQEVVTRHAYLHFGLNIPSRLGEMPVVDEFLDAVDD